MVDDDEALRESLCDILTFSGHEVESACDGLQALERLGVEPTIDCMVLDLFMPRLDGVGVLEALQDGPRVVVLSAFERVSEAEIERRYSQKVCAFLVKPVLPPILLRTVDDCLRRS